MTQKATLPPVTTTISVKVPVERAFKFFTQRMTAWWPANSHLSSEPFVEAIMEPRVGGRWFERAADGTECDWGQVLAYEPPYRVVLAWQIDAQFKADPDLSRASEVEVTFVAEGAALTRVDLVHRHIERHGGDVEKMRAAISSPGGWPGILGSYRDTVHRESNAEG